MRFQTAPYTEKRHVTQRREKQKTTGEKKKGKGLISGATSVATGSVHGDWNVQCAQKVYSHATLDFFFVLGT